MKKHSIDMSYFNPIINTLYMDQLSKRYSKDEAACHIMKNGKKHPLYDNYYYLNGKIFHISKPDSLNLRRAYVVNCNNTSGKYKIIQIYVDGNKTSKEFNKFAAECERGSVLIRKSI